MEKNSGTDALTRQVCDAILARFPDAVVTQDKETMGFGTAPGYKGLVFTVIPARAHVTLGIAHGASLPDPAGLMEGDGKVHRHVKIRAAEDLRRPELLDLMDAALRALDQATVGQGGAAEPERLPRAH
ncbi:DUF1801 domain-containing protein [Allorhizocola rhizosphaerae]|uniref:DUF1801 domain-containing protein n=1 Tax=Allorhizocola rhizosphaerae TaxID=1872709 RepID=UPI000E3C6C38|nr:DUF1801 domain-containing protein [Allorhizocola rhizosphaerae]